MSLADISIKRPTFITCVVIVMLAVGLLSLSKLGVDLFPDVTFPVVTVTTTYPGAGPNEIETLVSKPLEDEISTLSGIKRLTSRNYEGMSQVIAEFTLETDVKYAEQQIRDRVGSAKSKLPLDIDEPVIRRIDPSDQPVLQLSMSADLPEAKLFDVADDVIRPRIEQVSQIGLVEVLGGRKREIRVELDPAKLKQAELPVSAVAQKVGSAGENVPVGKVDQSKKEMVFRTIGEFRSVDDVKNTIVNFFGNASPLTVGSLGKVVDGLEDERSRAFINGKKGLFIMVYRQSGANTIAVVNALNARIKKLNEELQNFEGKPHIEVVRDTSVWIRANVEDVQESIMLGVILAVLVVFFFLANGRSTIITGLALPNSLIGAFMLMAVAGFTINIMTLLALSLSVGLLIDDAIVVRENIFRHIEMGKDPVDAARDGTAEVRLAVIATTLTVIAVFGPIAFLSGVVGQFFRQFGATVCFAMAISLFDALTIAPMLSAYFAGPVHGNEGDSLWARTIGRVLRGFDRFQTWLEEKYGRVLGFTIRRPFVTMLIAGAVFVLSVSSLKYVVKTFLPQQDAGEFAVGLDLPPGSNLDAMTEVALRADKILHSNPEVAVSALTVGGRTGAANEAEFYVHLTPAKSRKLNTGQVKEKVREQFKEIAFANPTVKDYDAVGGGQRPFNLNIIGLDQKQLDEVGAETLAYLKAIPGLKDVDTSYRPGKPEFQVVLDPERGKQLGVSTKLMGQELRSQTEGVTPAKFRELGREYDVRVRLLEEQRDLKARFGRTYVPNINGTLIHLQDVAKPVEAIGPATILRQDRGRLVQISADIGPGAGMGNIMDQINQHFKDKPLPQGMRYMFVGQAENFQELGQSMLTAIFFGVLFIFLVLSSLYESFVTPLTIMLALPLAMCGAFVALAVTRESLNIFSMIGTIMLLGVATKNSILLVDYAKQLIEEGMDRSSALIKAGKTRLRPILMTTMALIAGTFPIALGLNEASRQRTSMGIAIIGGLISSTVLTLVVVPAAFSYIDRYRIWSKAWLMRIFGSRGKEDLPHAEAARPANGHSPQKSF